MSPQPTADLALRNTARELVAAFAAAEVEVRGAFARIVAAEKAVNAAFGDRSNYPSIHVSATGDHHRDRFDDPDQAIKIMTRAAWRSIVERLELKRFMSIKRWDQLQDAIDKGTLPAITEENVTAFARGHLAQARDHLKDAVNEVFEWLRPRKGTATGDLKTNSELEVPPKVILGWMVERRFVGDGFHVNYRRSQNLIALENVFSALDGQGEINKNYQSALQTAIEQSTTGEGETALFRFRCCLNGNLHLWIKRLDLLARFNALAGGARLRPAEDEEARLRAEIAKARRENERLRARAGA